MTTILELLLDHNKIKVLIPSIKNKKNYYYQPSNRLHRFDEVTVSLFQNSIEQVIFKDSLQYTLEELSDSLQKVVDYRSELPNTVEAGKVGAVWNLYKLNCNQNVEIDAVLNTLCWSYDNINTWIYTKDSTVYLEISKSMQFSEEIASNIKCREIAQRYEPIYFTQIKRLCIKEWLEHIYNLQQELK